MDSRAFGSPIAFEHDPQHHNAVGNTTNIGARIVRAARVRLFDTTTRTNIVENSQRSQSSYVNLLSLEGNIVGVGILQHSIHVGMTLNYIKLFPSEVAVRVIEVSDASYWTGEVIGERLGMCLGLTIRWQQNLVRIMTTPPHQTPDLGNNPTIMFSSTNSTPTSKFDFEEPNFDNPSMGTRQGSNTPEPFFPISHTTETHIRDLPHVDGLSNLQSYPRTYSMANRTRASFRQRQRGEGRAQKVTLESTRAAKQKGGCKNNCLQDVDEGVILDQRYMAWGPKYNVRATWIRQMLQSFYTQTSGLERDKFVTKLDGQVVCNACYATALGYSQRRFKDLKTLNRVYGRVAAIHGNTCSLREKANVSAAIACFDSFVKEAGDPQPNRPFRRKVDNAIVPLILLPMQTQKMDVFHCINEEVKKIADGSTISISSFRKLWQKHFPHVHIPPHSRFSKCYHCWEYKSAMEGTTNLAAKEQAKALFIEHIFQQMAERRDYWAFKRSCYLSPEMFMCIIVDGMDQNSTMVPKMHQSVKNMEYRFVKTHLCGALVHGIGLYCDFWFDAHHKHDSNQVITTLLHVIQDVKRLKGFLPPSLRIQADNCTRENKNIYMFALCATLVGLCIFKEVSLSFLLVGHTHEDIDQRFSCISSVLRRHDINSMKEMFNLVESGSSPTEAFIIARLLRNIRDWKGFITPHLRVGGEAIAGITFPQHMRFYSVNGVPRVQSRKLVSDVWGPEEGLLCMKSLPMRMDNSKFAVVHEADTRELRALDDFIVYKERCISRYQHVEKNIDAIEETKEMKKFLLEHPRQDRGEEEKESIWPTEGNHDPVGYDGEERNDNHHFGDHIKNAHDEEAEKILATLPNLNPVGFFGYRRDRPSHIGVKEALRRGHVSVGGGGPSVNGAGPSSINDDPFPEFNPRTDVELGHVVAVSVDREEVESGIPFYIGKVIEVGKGRRGEKMKLCWYWPVVGAGIVEPLGCFGKRYTNCIGAQWEPSGEKHAWVDKETSIYSWRNEAARTLTGALVWTDVVVHGTKTEKRLNIPSAAKAHLLEYMAMQADAIDNEQEERVVECRD
jgi:hypothetical protein